jgi:AcrR family transcriptional regulator
VASRTSNSRERIVAAAQEEIELKGILGLRVQDVAERARVSVPLIYKYFGDRDGILAEALGAMFEEFVLQRLDHSEQYFLSLESPTIEDLVAMLALPRQDFRRASRWRRVQILAASMEIPALRTRLGLAQTAIYDQLITFMDQVQRKMTGGELVVSSAALAMLVQTYSFGFILNDLEDGGSRVSDEEFTHLMHAMLSGVFDVSQRPSLHVPTGERH